jgi:DNA modification methylase
MNKIEFGDNRQTMKKWAEEGVKVQTCVTSPPYFGLRDYGHEGQIGLEETPEEYIEVMVDVFRHVKEILVDDGTLWLNIGDSYATGSGGTNTSSELQKNNRGSMIAPRKQTRSGDLKSKDLIGIPWMLAFALRADGWYLRQDIIWHKPNPMPESVQDRCTKAHEYIFLLSKSKKYYFDNDAIKEPIQDESALRLLRGISDSHKNVNGAPGQTPHSMNKPRTNVRKEFDSSMGGGGTGFIGHSGYKNAEGELMVNENRNKRSVWTVTTKPYSGAHFAVFPSDLIEPCILAGAPVGGIVLDPFMGSGTTAQVAQNLGRQYMGCELNPEYKKLQDQRLAQESFIF